MAPMHPMEVRRDINLRVGRLSGTLGLAVDKHMTEQKARYLVNARKRVARAPFVNTFKSPVIARGNSEATGQASWDVGLGGG